MINILRGDFEVPIAGGLRRFDTCLGSIAMIEDRCGDLSIVEIVNRAVFGRRARDQRTLIAAALITVGHEPAEADTLAGRASVAEAEGFILALMGALGFEIAPRRDGGDVPLADASSGPGGGSSPSAP